MTNRFHLAAVLTLSLTVGLTRLNAFELRQETHNSAGLSEFAGRYGRGVTDILYFKIRGGKLTARPAFWHSIQVVEVKGDSFVVADRKDRGGSFIRNAGGEVTAVRIIGLAATPLRYEKLRQTGTLPLELLFEGRGSEAYERLSKQSEYDDLLGTGKIFFEHFPSRVHTAVEYLEGLAKQFVKSSDAHTLLGRAYVEAQMRTKAELSFRVAYALNNRNQEAIDYLIRLKALPAPAALERQKWKIPFSLNDLFKPPAATEIGKVRQLWSNRDLAPVEPKEVVKTRIRYGDVDVFVRIVSHRVHGFLHYGAVLSPVEAAKKSCPVIIEAKGVSWNYFPLDINEGLNLPGILGADLAHMVVVVPSFRGERMVLNGQEFLSEGDRTDNWDGSTDDALALLNVALQTTPEADSSRICAFGRSRGGSVAMLAAIRDSRIKGVVEWAGPTDWFERMSEEGWTQQELVEEGLRIHAKPNETAGQFIERFLLKAIDGTWDLETTRLKMIASSPLYFTASLPAMQIHHGVEDYNVPVSNAQALAVALKRRPGTGRPVEAYLYEGFGHDTDVQTASERSHKFLLEKLNSAH